MLPKEGKVEIVQALLSKQGINLKQTDSDNRIALHHAAINGHTRIVSLLTNHQGYGDVLGINLGDRWEMTPLHYATRYLHDGCVAALLDHPDIDTACRDNAEKTALE